VEGGGRRVVGVVVPPHGVAHVAAGVTGSVGVGARIAKPRRAAGEDDRASRGRRRGCRME
jgi:hypothetical protein